MGNPKTDQWASPRPNTLGNLNVRQKRRESRGEPLNSIPDALVNISENMKSANLLDVHLESSSRSPATTPPNQLQVPSLREVPSSAPSPQRSQRQADEVAGRNPQTTQKASEQTAKLGPAPWKHQLATSPTQESSVQKPCHRRL